MGFTNAYARWTLFIITSLIAYVGIYLDKILHVAKWHIHVGFAFAVVSIITSWILTYVLADTNPERDGQLIFPLSTITVNFTSVAFIINWYTSPLFILFCCFYITKNSSTFY